MRRRCALPLALWAAAGLVVAAALPARATGDPDPAGATALFDAAGYRRASYRAPVDRDPAPAARLPLARALRLRPGRDALFLDVLPAEGARRDPATGVWLGAPPHQTIPGASWHPEAGRAAPDPVLWEGLIAAVRAARARHPRWPVVVFCRADCWMSWNAARRLALGGIDRAFWLPEGIDGWHDARRPLATVRPVVVPASGHVPAAE